MKLGMGVMVGVVVVILVAAGIWMWGMSDDSDVMEEGAMMEEGEMMEEEAPGQFMQEAPETQPASGEESMMEGESMMASDSPVASEDVTITITDSGFEPSAVTIAAGTTVTFVNNGQAAHWPASDVHPTHEILPEFDSKRGLATGETYSYTFEEAGKWAMHDHLRPQFTGVITVQ